MMEDRLEHYFEAVFPRSDAQKKKGEKPQRWGFLAGDFREPTRPATARRPWHALGRLQRHHPV